MPVDASRIQGFGSTPEPQKTGNFSGFLDALRDQVSGPAMRSAVDSFSMQFNDAMESASEDMSEMALEIKSFVSGATGFASSSSASTTKEDKAPDEGVRVQLQRAEIVLSPRQKAEADTLMSKFCQNYGAARVAPRATELEDMWLRCSVLQPNTVASAIYDQLSFAGGDLEWQPRLRVLYLLETFYWKGGVGRDISTGILNHGGGLLQHLVSEVPQTKEKAEQVMLVLSGNGQQPPETQNGQVAASAEKKEAISEKRAAQAPPQDLLDLSSSSCATSSATAPAVGTTRPVEDLLSAAPAEPPIIDLVSMMAPPAPMAAAAPAADLTRLAGSSANSPSAPASVQPGSAAWQVFSGQTPTGAGASGGPAAAPAPFANAFGSQQGLPSFPNSSGIGGVAATRDARAGYGQALQPTAMQQVPPQPRRYIPAPQELPPGERQADPFAWAEDITKTASQSV